MNLEVSIKDSLVSALVVSVAAFNVSVASAQPHDPNVGLVPITEFDGPMLEFEFPGLLIGVAEYAEGPTGTTIFYFPAGVMAAVDVRGGSPGTLGTDAMRLGYESPWVNAIALSGGSSYGLAAATGATLEIRTHLDDPGWWTNIPSVGGAIIFDLGGRRYNAVTPDERLGRAAIRAARAGVFPLGARGGGRFAMQGAYFGERQHSGQGGAFGKFDDIRIAVFTIVNSLGAVVDRSGKMVRCGVPTRTDCPPVASKLGNHSKSSDPQEVSSGGLTSNTTISLVVTNKKLSFSELQRFGVQVHTSMARAIQPFHTIEDGDTLFAVTTGAVEDSTYSIDELGVLASEIAWDAILASVPSISDRPSPDERELPPEDLLRYVGRYSFAPGMEASTSVMDGKLVIAAPKRGSMYLPSGSVTPMAPAVNGDFLLQTERKDIVSFDMNYSGQVVGLTINPGPWPVKARRL